MLDERMWERAPWPRIEAEERDRIVKQFGHAQSRKWQEKAGGAYFWTYKNEYVSLAVSPYLDMQLLRRDHEVSKESDWSSGILRGLSSLRSWSKPG